MSRVPSELLELPVTELAPRIRSRALSPIDLTEAYLDRIDRLNARYNAFEKVTPELALEQARAAAAEIQRGHYRGPLHGIPYGAKDLLATAGIETSWGAGIQNARSPFTCTSTSASNRSTDLLTNSWSPCATITIRPQSVPWIRG